MKRFIAIILSALIMFAIFTRIDVGEFKVHLSQMAKGLFVLAIFFFIPQIGLSAFRWQIMARNRVPISLWESTKLILASNALNILIPSRAGDLSKAYFLSRDGRLDIKRGMNLVLFEKYIDLVSLGVVVLTGILWSERWDAASLLGLVFALSMIGLFPVLYFVDMKRWVAFSPFERGAMRKIKGFLLDTQEYLNEVKKNHRQLAFILCLSVFLWFVHIVQFYIIFLSLHSHVSPWQVFRLVPLAILVGLIPLTIAGVGTRDSAMIYFFSSYEKASLIAGVGLFASLRYFVPGILGLPFLNEYIVKEQPRP